MKWFLFLSAFLTGTNCFSQRSLPYPIILVHGFGGNGTTTYWGPMLTYFQSAGLSVSAQSIGFNLNADDDLSQSRIPSDVKLLQITSLGNHDVYTVNFTEGKQSNQSAATKQGYALHDAIYEVMKATGVDKVVLVGHSMGGLAIREYIQNSAYYQNDGRHHVAKIVTIGTPHLGSNLGSDGMNLGGVFSDDHDERSEAVRDLRTSYKTGKKGVYLFGGWETSEYIQRGSFGGEFYNLDVNCNGRIGDHVTGLNERGLPGNIAYSCVIGQGIPGIYGNSDGVVLTSSQNINNVYSADANVFYYNCPVGSIIDCHINEPKRALFETMQALDEPNFYGREYELKTDGNYYTGFFSAQSWSSTEDEDLYRISVSGAGVLKISAVMARGSGGKAIVRNEKREVIAVFQGESLSESLFLQMLGTYYISFVGNHGGGWRQYRYSTSFCPAPVPNFVSISGNLRFCQGQSVTLTAKIEADSYRWYKDDIIDLGVTARALTVKDPGFYSVRVSQCGHEYNSLDVQVVVDPCITGLPAVQVTEPKVSPNPSNGAFHLLLPPGEYHVEVCDVTGRVFYQKEMTSSGNIDPMIGPGQYFVRVSGYAGSWVLKTTVLR